MLKYVAYNEAREKVTGVLEAPSEEEAELALWRSNLTIISLRKVRRPPSIYELFPTLFRVRTKDLIFFTQQLVALLDSGVPLFPSLKQLALRVPNRRLRQVLGQVIRDIETGARFSQALSNHPSVFPELYCRLASIGEESGNLSQMLHRIVDYLVKQEELINRVKRALTYPAMVALVGIAGIIVLLVFALPAMSGLFELYGANLPLSTRVLIGLNEVIKAYGIWIAVGLFALFLGGWQYMKTPGGAARRDRLALHLPVIGRIARDGGLARITSTLAVLLSAGIPLAEGLTLVEKIARNFVLSQGLRRARQEVVAGQSLSQALAQHKAFPLLLVETIRTAEQTGTLPQALETQSKFYERETDAAISALASLIEPAVILVMAGGVGFIAAAVFTSIYSLIGQIK